MVLARPARPRLALDTDVLVRMGHRDSGSERLLVGAVHGDPFVLIITQVVLREFCEVLAEHQRMRPVHHIFRLSVLLNAAVDGRAVFPSWEPTWKDVQDNLHLAPRDPDDVAIILSARQALADTVLTYNVRHFSQQQSLRAQTPEQFFEAWDVGGLAAAAAAPRE